MFTPVKRIGAQRFLSTGAVSALKSEKLHGGFQSRNNEDLNAGDESGADVKGPFLSQDSVWRNDTPLSFGVPFGSVGHATQLNATQPGLQSHLQLLQAAAQQMDAIQPMLSTQETLGYEDQEQLGLRELTSALLSPPTIANEVCNEQPARDMEAFLQELSETSSSHADISYDHPEAMQYGMESYTPVSSPLSYDAPYDPLLTLAIVDPAKSVQHFNAMSFDTLNATIVGHLWNTGPVPDIALFYLFRKVHSKDQADQAVAALMTDRDVRTRQGNSTPYSEVTSAAVFNALNRTGGETLVVIAAEKAFELGLTLSRSNMYHLMKQYSVQGKVDHVEKLFRALEATGKSWNSNCIVIMMLAYFNQGRFEDADKLRHELNARGIKISERIENRLDNLLTGVEKWRWEDKIFYRPRKTHLPPPPGFQPLHNLRPMMAIHPSIPGATMIQTKPYAYLAMNGLTSQATMPWYEAPQSDAVQRDLPPVTLKDAVKEPRIHLNILRSAGFDDLYNVLAEFVRVEGPVENVCISFLFRKVDAKKDVEKAMEFLKEERAARTAAGISEEYNETTCSRIFTALFRTGASDLAFACAENAQQTGLVLSGKALHELLKSFATRNDVEKVEQIWKLVKLNAKPSSRIVYSIFRTYFDNGMMDRASAFHKEIQSIGIKLSASATRNIEDVLSGAKSWVRDPHSNEF